MKHLLALLATSCLMACATPPASDEPPVLPAEKDTCGAANHANLVGKPATDPAVPPASRQVRHLPPNSIMTLDFNLERLNIEIDAKGVITRLRCG